MAEPMTITIDPQRQQQIERYCRYAGKSRDMFINDILAILEASVYIPWMRLCEEEKSRRKASMALMEQRERAMNGETPDLSMDEIDEIIARVREERYSKQGKQ